MKSKMTQIDGEIYYVHGSKESIQWKWVYYTEQSIDSMQFLSSYQWHFHRPRTNNFTICMEIQNPQIARAILRKKNGT